MNLIDILNASGGISGLATGGWLLYTWLRTQRTADRTADAANIVSLSTAEAQFRADLSARLAAQEARGVTSDARAVEQDKRIWGLTLRLYAFERCAGMPPHGPCPLRAILPPIDPSLPDDPPPSLIIPPTP